MRLSVVIPYFRAARTIGDQLEALANQKMAQPWEVIVSDNESSDELSKIIRPYEVRVPSLRVVDASDHRGPGHARNVGVEASSGDVIAFCDADDVVGDGWLAAMDSALRVHDFVACRLDFQRLNPPWAQYAFRGHLQQKGLQRTRYPPYLLFAGAGTLGVKRWVHQSVGGFDESWPMQEDKDFCIRVQLAGTELHFVPDAVLHIRSRATLQGMFNQGRSYAEYDMKTYRRYRPAGVRVSHPWRQYMAAWNHLIRTAAELKSQETRASWVWRLGWQIGLLEGSIRHFTAPV